MLNFVLASILPLIAVAYTIVLLQRRRRLISQPIPGQFLFKGVFGQPYTLLIPYFLSISGILRSKPDEPILYVWSSLLISLIFFTPLLFKSVVKFHSRHIYFGGNQHNLKYEAITGFEVHTDEIHIHTDKRAREVILKKDKLLSPEWDSLVEQFKALATRYEKMEWDDKLALEEYPKQDNQD